MIEILKKIKIENPFTQCPSYKELIALSKVQKYTYTDDYRRLAKHIVWCFRCAQAWEIFQTQNYHLDPMIILAYINNKFPISDDGQLLKEYAQSHLNDCPKCKDIKSKLSQIIIYQSTTALTVITAKKLLYLYKQIPTKFKPIPIARGRSAEKNLLAYIVDSKDVALLDETGNPKKINVKISEPIITANGELEINISDVNRAYSHAQLIGMVEAKKEGKTEKEFFILESTAISNNSVSFRIRTDITNDSGKQTLILLDKLWLALRQRL